MKSVVWSKNSLDSLQSIYNYIYENSPQNAEKVVDNLFVIEFLNLKNAHIKFSFDRSVVRCFNSHRNPSSGI